MVLLRALLYPVQQLLQPVSLRDYSHSQGWHSREIFKIITQQVLSTNIKKFKFQGLRRVYDVPSRSCFVPKGTAPKGAPTLILPNLTTNPNCAVVDLFEY
jgi:hypothetical protein